MASGLPIGGTDFAFVPLVPKGAKEPKIKFHAFIDSISDSFSPQWGEYMDMGRADPKFMFNQFTRNISIDFKIIALQRGDHEKNLDDMNILSAITYPVYKSGVGFNGVYVKFYIGKFIQEIGLISSLTFTIDNESPWIDDIPIYINCSMDIRVIGDKKPKYKQRPGPYRTGLFGKGIT